MSKSYTVEEIVVMHYEWELSKIKEVPLPEFSKKHQKRMQKAFDLFDKNVRKLETASKSEVKKPLSFGKRMLLVAVIIILLAFTTGAMILFMSEAFKGNVFPDNTMLFSIDVGDSPATIEKVYTLSVVPEGYEFSEDLITSDGVYTQYKNEKGHILFFSQHVKSKFTTHVNTEGYELQKTNINGCDAVFIEYSYDYGKESDIFWNNEDYVLSLGGVFTKEEIIDLAKSNEIKGF